MSWQLTGVSIAVMVAISIAFLLSGSYTRVQLASGTIEPAAGAITITARRPGVLTELRVQEGQPVRHGQRLLAIQAEETLAEGGSLADRVRRTINRRERELALQRAYTQKAAAADRERLRMQIIGTRSEIAELDRQIGDQRRIMDIIAKDLARASEVAARGFISKRDLDSRELSLITGRKELYQLQQQRSSKVAQIGEIERTIQQAGANADVQLAGTALSQSDLLERLVQSASLRGYSVTSPINGIVTALRIKLGESVIQGQQMFVIVPQNSSMQAELYLPTSAAAFVSPNQHVRIAVDAYPYDRYGTIDATVKSVSMTTVADDRPTGTTKAGRVYIVVATIAQPWFVVAGRRQKLIPGMSVNGRIVTERRTLAQWLLEPLLALSQR